MMKLIQNKYVIIVVKVSVSQSKKHNTLVLSKTRIECDILDFHVFVLLSLNTVILYF